MAEDKEVRKVRQNVERRQEQYWSDKIASGRQARMAEGAGMSRTSEEAQRQKVSAAAGMAAAGVLAVSIASAPTANAQDIGFLERMSQERNQAVHQPIAPLPAAPERLQTPPQRLTCMGTDAWQPVRAQPSHGGSVIGATQPQVAATGRTINGYDEINFNGHAGYIPSSTVRPYQSPVNPSVKCSVSGVRDNGAPVFHYGIGAG